MSTAGGGGSGGGDDDASALRLEWTFGFNNRLVGGVHNLSTADRFALFYASAHTGVVYDAQERTQLLLQGHKNPITAAAVSADKRFVATGDTNPPTGASGGGGGGGGGGDTLLCVWESVTGVPLKTVFGPHRNRGVVALDFTADGNYLVSVSAVDEADGSQSVAVWDWQSDSDAPVCETAVPRTAAAGGQQTTVTFNPWNAGELMTNGPKNTLFWNWSLTPGSGSGSGPEVTGAVVAGSTALLEGRLGAEQGRGTLECYAPTVHRAKFGTPLGLLTSSAFLANGKAVTGTADGDVVVWEPVAAFEDANAAANANHAANAANAAASPFVERAGEKLMRLGEGALTVVCVVSGGGSGLSSYLCLGGEDGAVRFYDMAFRLEAWFEDMEAGAVTSVSFAAHLPPSSSAHGGGGGGGGDIDFATPDFVVGTEQAYVVAMEASLFEEVEAESRRGTLVVQGLGGAAHGVAMHPQRAELVIATYSGALYLWDYDAKTLLMVRQWDGSKLRPRTVVFDPSGAFLLVGFTNGTVKLLDPSSLQDLSTFKNGRDAVIHADFSPRGDLFATADASHHVYLHRLSLEDGGNGGNASPDPAASSSVASGGGPSQGGAGGASWQYLGRYRSHGAPVVALKFGLREGGGTALVSLGEDKFLVEYDCAASCVEDGVVLVDAPRRIEQGAVPTCACWHPLLGDGDTKDFEDRIVTGNDEYKLKEWNADNKSCRRTSLGPAFGGPLTALVPLAPERPPQPPAAGAATGGGAVASSLKPYAAYATAEQVVGLVQLPLDGNPAKAMGLVAHPGCVAALCAAHDGTLLATSGGADATVNLWSIHVDAVAAAAHASLRPTPDEEAVGSSGGGPSGLAALAVCGLGPSELPLVRQLAGGLGGAELQDLMDFFYYAQLRAQGEDAAAPRDIRHKVPLHEIPSLMCALGYYPSEAEANNMMNEVKYSAFTTHGDIKEECGIADFLQLYVNHRPVAGVGQAQINAAFKLIARQVAQAAAPDGLVPPPPMGAGHGGGGGGLGCVEEGALLWGDLKKALLSQGEPLDGAELSKVLDALIGYGDLDEGAALTAADLVGEVLGFEGEEVGEEGEEEGGEGGVAASAAGAVLAIQGAA